MSNLHRPSTLQDEDGAYYLNTAAVAVLMFKMTRADLRDVAAERRPLILAYQARVRARMEAARAAGADIEVIEAINRTVDFAKVNEHVARGDLDGAMAAMLQPGGAS